MGKLYPVEQRHRDAAASGYFAWVSSNSVIPSKMLSGKADDHSMVQSFARFEAEHLTRIEATPAVDREALERAWTDFLDANPDDLTSPEEWPDHALVTCDQMIGIVENALALPPVKQSDGLAERVREAIDKAVPDYIEIYRIIRHAGRSIAERAHAVDDALSAIRSLDITRMGGSQS